MEVKKQNHLKKLIPYIAKYKWRAIFSFLMLFLSSLFSVAEPYVMKMIIDTLTIEGSETSFYFILFLVFIYFTFSFSSSLFDGLRFHIFAKAQSNIRREVSLDVFNHLINLPSSYHSEKATGSLARKITRGVNGLESLYFFTLFNVVPTLLEITLVLIVLLFLFPISFSLVFLSFIGLYIISTVFLTEKRQKILLEANKKDDKATGGSIDAILNYETVKYFTNENFEHRKYNSALKDWVVSSISSIKTGANLNIAQGFVISLGLSAVLVLASREFFYGNGTIGDFVMVTSYLAKISRPLNFLGFIYRRIKEALADIDGMFGILDVKNDLIDKQDAKDLEKVRGEIKIENVSFSYEKKRSVISGLNVEIPAKSRVAFVGYSGSGKSTISKLILRMYDVDEGRVLLDGVDIRDIKQRCLRKNIGVVAQDTVLFNDTIYNNILYGKTNATKEEVENAAQAANIHDFILKELPDGYNTVVGERGVKLSGGEKQRVAIARMIIKNPAVLVFDEATASLDTKSEKIIQDAIKNLSHEGKTTIVIAHRLSTIVDFDKIIVMSEGKICEEGNHGELLERGGTYANLWKIQAKK